MSGGEGLSANLAMERLMDVLGVRVHARHFIARLALRTLELVIIDHSAPMRCLGTYPNCGPAAIPGPREIKNRVSQITL